MGYAPTDTHLREEQPTPLAHPPPAFPSRGTNLYERIDALLFTFAPWLVIESLNTRHELEHIRSLMSEFKDALTENTTATRDSIAAQDHQIDQLAETAAKLQTALDDLLAAGTPVSAEDLAELRGNTASLVSGLGRLRSDDAPVVVEPDPNGPVVDDGTGTDTGGTTEPATGDVEHTPSAT